MVQIVATIFVGSMVVIGLAFLNGWSTSPKRENSITAGSIARAEDLNL